jgi:hypothetical protein
MEDQLAENCAQARLVWVGQLMSDAFDVGVVLLYGVKARRRPKIKVKGVGQECPTHTRLATAGVIS